VLHVKKDFDEAIRVGSDDHLASAVYPVTVEMRRSLRLNRDDEQHLEPTSIERDEVVHFMQLVHVGRRAFPRGKDSSSSPCSWRCAAANLAVAA